MHVQATLTSFDDTGSSDVEIEVLTQDITRLFRKCELRLQQFGQTTSATEADSKVIIGTLKLLASFVGALERKSRKATRAHMRSQARPTSRGLDTRSFITMSIGCLHSSEVRQRQAAERAVRKPLPQACKSLWSESCRN